MKNGKQKGDFDLLREWMKEIGMPILHADREDGVLLTVVPGEEVLHRMLIRYDKRSASLQLIVAKIFDGVKKTEAFLRKLLCINGKLVLGKFEIWDNHDKISFEVNIPTTAGLNQVEFERAVAAVESTMKEYYLPLKKMVGDPDEVESEAEIKRDELRRFKLN